MTIGENLFWDSCVFIRYLTGEDGQPCYEDICRFVEEAKSSKWKIHYSTIVYTEIRYESFKAAGYGSIMDLFSDLGTNFNPIEPNPNILIAAGELRSSKSTNPADPNLPASREIGTPDAIHLTTCLYARDVLGIEDIVFHTFDRGKGKGWEGRTVPIIGFECWFPEPRSERVSDVCSLTRIEPVHPEPTLTGLLSNQGNPLGEARPQP